MNFASTQSTISSCHDVSLDINLLGCFSCKIQRYRIPNPPRPTCRVSKSVPGCKACPLSDCPNCPPTLNRPPPTCPPHLFFCQKLPDWPILGRIKVPRAGLTGAHRVKEGRNLSVRSTSTRGSERYLKLKSTDWMSGYLIIQCDCVRSRWYLLLFTNAGPNDLVVEKNTNVGHISFLFLDSKFIGPSKNLYNQK